MCNDFVNLITFSDIVGDLQLKIKEEDLNNDFVNPEFNANIIQDRAGNKTLILLDFYKIYPKII